jgi:integral membrane protein (TIGR00529 family)
MFDLVRLAIVFVLILFLLRRKWNVGYVLLTGSGALAVLYLMKPSSLFLVVKNALTAGITIKLLIALTFIRIFEFILRDKALLAKMMESMKGLFRNKKAVVVSMPLLIGMLPSIGGAYFSAPMVDEATRDLSITPEEKAFANYWFRHPWEFILPLYPGIILASVLTSIEVRTFIIRNLSYAITMFLVGLWGLKGITGSYKVLKNVSRKGLWSFLPIVILLGFVIIWHMELHVALVILVLMLMIYFRYSPGKAVEAFRYGFSRDVVLLIIGVMFFKEALEVSGAVSNISRFFSENHIPMMPILFLLPFLTGMLTGITVGFVGSTFPLILSLTGSDPHAFTLAFASGFIGVLLSPVHVCLILTKEYFKADMWGIYKKTLPAAGAVLMVAVLEFLVI